MRSIAKVGLLSLALLITAAFLAKDTLVLMPLSPKQNETTFELRPTFSWNGKAVALMIDDNPDFTTPKIINVTGFNTYRLNSSLETKRHYWRLEGSKDGPIRTFLIEGKAAIEVEQTSRGTLLKNKGNVDLEVEVPQRKEEVERAASSDDLGMKITGAIVVPVGKNRLLPSKYPEKIEARSNEG